MNIDPTKMDLTQDEFIAICGTGLQSYMSVGAIITLNNYYCEQYEVIDVNHDGTTNTVDIMAHTQVNTLQFNTSSSNNDYNNSIPRTWLNSTYIDAFDYDVRELMKTMVVVTKNTTQHDKVKMLSWRELGITYNSTFLDINDGGSQYPVFTAGSYDIAIQNRWRDAGNYGDTGYCWTRSRNSSNDRILCVMANGSIYAQGQATGPTGVLPVLRF